MFNPFWMNVSFLYSLEMPENLWFSDVFRGYRNKICGLKWVFHEDNRSELIEFEHKFVSWGLLIECTPLQMDNKEKLIFQKFNNLKCSYSLFSSWRCSAMLLQTLLVLCRPLSVLFLAGDAWFATRHWVATSRREKTSGLMLLTDIHLDFWEINHLINYREI